ncbi:MAG: hypothetical protein QW597_04390 [Thermoplasmataceae archaeon]
MTIENREFSCNALYIPVYGTVTKPDGREKLPAVTLISEFMARKPITIDPVFPDLVRQVLRSRELLANLPFSKELWNYRLREYIDQIKEHVMLITGKKDVQRIEETLSKHRDDFFPYSDCANHVLKLEDLPLERHMIEYASLHYNAVGASPDWTR